MIQRANKLCDFLFWRCRPVCSVLVFQGFKLEHFHPLEEQTRRIPYIKPRFLRSMLISGLFLGAGYCWKGFRVSKLVEFGNSLKKLRWRLTTASPSGPWIYKQGGSYGREIWGSYLPVHCFCLNVTKPNLQISCKVFTRQLQHGYIATTIQLERVNKELSYFLNQQSSRKIWTALPTNAISTSQWFTIKMYNKPLSIPVNGWLSAQGW